MFELRVKVGFPAAHFIPGYPGDCARLHGHNWELEVFVRARELDRLGMAVDFRDLKKACNEIVSAWDHQNLNELEDFQSDAPTAENVAKISYRKLAKQFSSSGIKIKRVNVWENDRCFAGYWEDA